MYGPFGVLVDASEDLGAHVGDRAAAGTLAEAMLTVQMKPYPRARGRPPHHLNASRRSGARVMPRRRP